MGDGAVDIGTIAPGLELAGDGIWYARTAHAVSYPSEGHEGCFEVEESSFWFAHRNRCITALLSAFPPKRPGAFLDVGGGNGFVSRAIERAGLPVVLVEPGETGARNAKARGVSHVVCARLEDAHFTKDSFPAAGLFDVIEHLPDDSGLLRTVHSLLHPGGRLYLTVPAFPFLWSEEDETAGHHRRHTIESLKEAVQRGGFTPEFATFVFRFLPLPVFLFRTIPFRLRRHTGGLQWRREALSRDHAAGNPRIRRILDAVLEREIRNIERKRPMRFGGSILMVARA